MSPEGFDGPSLITTMELTPKKSSLMPGFLFQAAAFLTNMENKYFK